MTQKTQPLRSRYVRRSGKRGSRSIEPIAVPADWLPVLTPPQALVLRAFRNAQRYSDGGGPTMTLGEIRKRAKGANPRGVKEVLNGLEWKKCVRFYPTYGMGGEVRWALTALGRRVLEGRSNGS